MSQNDYNIANQTFPNTRVDLNGAFQALASMSGGASAPSTTYAGQTWHDTTNDLMKIRNKANSAWITVAKFDTSNDRWDIRSNIIQAASTAGITLKSSSGATILSISNTGVVTTVGNVVVIGDISVTGTVDGVNIAAEETRLRDTSGENTGDQTLIETFQSKQTLSNDTEIDFALASGVDEHIFALRSVMSDTLDSNIYVKFSDDDKVTFESLSVQRVWNNGTYVDDTGVVMFLATAMTSTPADAGVGGGVTVSQLSGKYPHVRSDTVFQDLSSASPRQQKSDGYVLTTSDLTDVRFFATNLGSSLLVSGEIIYSTRTYA